MSSIDVLQEESFVETASYSADSRAATSYNLANFWVVRKASRQLLTAEAHARSQTNACGICDGNSGAGTDVSLSTWFLPLSVQFPYCSVIFGSPVADAFVCDVTK